MSMPSVAVPTQYAVQSRRPKNLMVKISINHKNSTVSYSTLHDEHLSNYASRSVIVEADFDCTLVFSNPSFFGLSSPNMTLHANVSIVLTVPADLNQGGTEYWVEFPLPVTNVMYAAKPIGPCVPPKIIFP